MATDNTSVNTTIETVRNAHKETAGRLCTLIMERKLIDDYGFRRKENGKGWLEYLSGSISCYTSITVAKPSFDRDFSECLKLYCYVTIKTFCENGHPEMYDDSELVRLVPLSYLPKFLEDKAHIHTKLYWDEKRKELLHK